MLHTTSTVILQKKKLNAPLKFLHTFPVRGYRQSLHLRLKIKLLFSVRKSRSAVNIFIKLHSSDNFQRSLFLVQHSHSYLPKQRVTFQRPNRTYRTANSLHIHIFYDINYRNGKYLGIFCVTHGIKSFLILYLLYL